MEKSITATKQRASPRRPVFVRVGNDHVGGLFADDEDRSLNIKARDAGEDGRVDNPQPKGSSYPQPRV